LLPAQSKERRRDCAARRQLNPPRSLAKSGSVFGTLFKEPQSTRYITQTISSRFLFVYTLLNPHSKRQTAVLFKLFITSIIIWDLLFYLLRPDRCIEQQYSNLFQPLEDIVSWICMAEYALRLFTCMENKKYRDHVPVPQ
jgi:hypothetical protein